VTQRQIHCRHVLTASGWRDDSLLELDGAGMITGLRVGVPAGDAVSLHGPVIPGMPNVHSHGFQALIAGLTGQRAAGGDSFWTWRERMYEMAGRLDPEGLEQCMGGVYLRMLRAGYTSCGEFHYLHNGPDGQPYANPAELSERVMAAAQASGIALTLLPVLYCRSGFGADSVNDRQRRFATGVDGYLALLAACDAVASGNPLFRIGLAPHSLRAVDEASLAAVLQAAGPGRSVHIHVAEQKREVEEAVAALGARALEWLLEHCPVDARWCLVHATHAEPRELRRAAKTGAVAGLCPTTEADLGDGIFDAEYWLAAGGRFGIGSDSNLRLSAGEELRLLEFTQRLRSGRRNVLADAGHSCGRHLYERAAAGGARALGQPVGHIEAGCRADLVELEPDDPRLAGLRGDRVLDSYVFAGDERLVRSVWVAGRRVLEKGDHAAAARLESGFAQVMRVMRT